jgi:hypothetical protein
MDRLFGDCLRPTLSRTVRSSAEMTLLKLAVSLFSFLLFGCAAHTWTRPNTTEQEIRRDLEQCERDRNAIAGESFFLERCMFSKGYTEE